MNVQKKYFLFVGVLIVIGIVFNSGDSGDSKEKISLPLTVKVEDNLAHQKYIKIFELVKNNPYHEEGYRVEWFITDDDGNKKWKPYGPIYSFEKDLVSEIKGFKTIREFVTSGDNFKLVAKMKQLSGEGYNVGLVDKDLDWYAPTDVSGYKWSKYHLLTKEDIIKECYQGIYKDYKGFINDRDFYYLNNNPF